jgi:predicted DNA-binding ribbon-helix-helix protein
VEAKPNDPGPHGGSRTPDGGSARPNPTDGGGFAGASAPPLYALSRKRSVTIAGHETSVSLEPVFWEALEAAAGDEALPLNALIARIDAERLEASGRAPNLTSALRQWLFARTGNARG